MKPNVIFLACCLSWVSCQVPDNFLMDNITNLIPVCNRENAPNHQIYCNGPILEAVMAFELYHDSKTFVDKPLKYPPQVVLDKYKGLFPTQDDVNKYDLQKFIDENFYEAGTEMQSCQLDDWNEKPLKLMSIADPNLRSWAFELNLIWKSLCREVDPIVRNESERFSLLYVPNRFIVPGGRFREFYYWDSYWTIKGLLASGMYDTVKSMLLNFIYIVEKYGFIPNGGRVYYLTRSQPPLLTGMVYEYYEATHDINFLIENVGTLEKELYFWDTHRMVDIDIDGRKYQMYQYRADSNSPRPESFKEDVELTKHFTKTERKQKTWQDLASAAESGWDFSSRWFRNSVDMKTIETTNIVPVDLNSFLCWNMNILSYFFDEINELEKAEEFRNRLGKFRSHFQKVFYLKNESGWFDFNLRTGVHNIKFYPSMASPLFTRCYHSLNHRQAEKIFDKMEEKGAFKFVGGIPTSLQEDTNQQWDFPNGWSPLNHIIIEGLRQSESPRMQYKAFLLAQKWILSNYRVFKKTGVMPDLAGLMESS
uniref:Trehalase n=1 Tax=Bursaphelenchus xylophilus TaxID=6326 RepID=A0A1I7SWA6_BURXY